MPPVLAPMVDAYKEQQARLGRDVGDELALAELLLQVHRDKPRVRTNKDGTRAPVSDRNGTPVTLGVMVQQAQQRTPKTPRGQASALKKVVGRAPTGLKRFLKYLERERARNRDPRLAAKVAAARDAECQAQLDGIREAIETFVSHGLLQADVLTPQQTPSETHWRVMLALVEAERAGTLPRIVEPSQARLDQYGGRLRELIKLWPGVSYKRIVSRRE